MNTSRSKASVLARARRPPPDHSRRECIVGLRRRATTGAMNA